MDRKLFFFDVDGTILYNEKVSVRVQKAIENIRKKGHLCFIASGRPPAFISKYIKDIGFDGFILCNGAVIIHDGKVISESYLDYNKLKELVDFVEEVNNEYILQTSTKSFIRKDCKNLLNFYSRCKIDFNELQFDFNKEEQLHRTSKMEIWPSDEEMRKEFIKRLRHFNYVSYPQTCLEIYSKEISKATGIKKLMKYLNIPFEQTYCFGDASNDIEMFESVSHSYAMKNANEDVKAKAKEVCPGVEEDGVAVILESLL